MVSRAPPGPRRRLLAALAVLLLVLATLPGAALAAPVQGFGDNVVVGPGQTVDSVQAVGGTVIIHGTVDGDVSVAAGTLLIDGVVHGNVQAGSGAVTIDGRVDGNVVVGAGTLDVGRNAVIGGTLNGGAGSATIAGTVDGDATLGTGTLVLQPTATFGGNLRYNGALTDNGATVQGDLVRDTSLGAVNLGPIVGVGRFLFTVYGFLVNLVLGAILLLAFPAGSRRLADDIESRPVRAGLYGLAVVIGVPILLLVLVVTIIGIPLAIVGAILFGLTVWVASVYGRYAVGEWLVGYTDVDNRWLALLVGLVVVGLVALVPILGGVVEFLVLLLGLGALAVVGRRAYGHRGRSEAPATAPASEPGTEGSTE